MGRGVDSLRVYAYSGMCGGKWLRLRLGQWEWLVWEERKGRGPNKVQTKAFSHLFVVLDSVHDAVPPLPLAGLLSRPIPLSPQ